MAIDKVEVCANCGLIGKSESKSFKCPQCGCEVSVVVSREIFEMMVKEGHAKEK